jgi:hypothetical protein
MLTYQPMLELMALLQALDFSVFMCTDSSRDFMRVIAGPAYGLRRERVIGSEVQIQAVDVYRFRTRRSGCDLRFGRMTLLGQDRGLCPFASST